LFENVPREPDAFQAYARQWLAANAPPPPKVRLPLQPNELTTQEQLDYLVAWQQKAYDAGLVGCDYPKEYGGGGHTGFQRIANAEMARAKVPYLVNLVGLSMAAPTILVHGTDEQKRRFLARALRCDDIWCQGFSEPGAGSDMANQQTFAEKRGDKWIVNGHKVWTSYGRFAHWMILLARTSREHKYDGLTYFLCPIAGHPGVTVRPLVKITGDGGFNEVLFENVEIPDSLRLDAVGKGWTVAMTTLTYERGAAETPSGGAGERSDPIAQLVALAKRTWRDGVRASDDPITRDAIVQQWIVGEGLRQNGRRTRVPALCDHPLRVPLQSKLTGSEWQQNLSRLGVEIAGAASTLFRGDGAAPDGGHWPMSYMNSYGNTIAAGANEIQRNILGERILGLPKTK
jgi:alkylation response protein AidB-like acyl-CoA dehydrogenase